MTAADHARFVVDVLGERWEAAAARVATGAPDPEALFEVCRRCEVAPFVHARLDRAGRFDLVGPAARERLTAFRHKIRNDNLLLLARLEQALDALASRGVVPILLKGADTLHRFYESFDERMLVDIDILVREEQLPEALEALEEAGWTVPESPGRAHWIRGSHHLPLHGPGPVPVDLELHWNLVQRPRYRLDPGELFLRAEPIEVAGRGALRLEDHDAVAHLLLHHFSHYFDHGLKSLIDLRFISSRPGFDWGQVRQRLEDWEGLAAAGAALAHITKVWPELIPAPVVPMIPFARWRRALTWPLRSEHPLELFRNTRNRRVQLYIAAVMLERPGRLPGWLLHRATRDDSPGKNPLEHAQPGAPTDRSET